ncbi:MAG: Ni/Fe-hydrogenase, b-type cytochrome subunit [Nitrospirota bacterium]
MQNKVYVWEVPVRLTHWITFACLLVLSFTGIYISSPFITPSSGSPYVMGWMRFIHFVTAYVFVVNIAVRIYWSFAGNRYANWRAFFPFSSEQTAKLIRQMFFYALIGKKPAPAIGHTPLAGVTYFLIFLLFAVSAITGFALYSLPNPGGVMNSLFGWVFSIFSIPMTRLIHHLIMWLLLYFTILHIYISMFLNSVEKSGILGSIFDGYKFIDTEKAE